MIRKETEKNKFVDSLLNASGKKDYRKELSERQPEMRQAKKIEKDRSWAVEKGYEKTEFNNPIARNSSSVRPSRCDVNGGISDMGGPTKQVGVTGKNSIWDSEVLKRLASTPSSQERMAEEKTSSNHVRMIKQAEYKQSMSPKIGENDPLPQKTASVTNASVTASNKGWVPSNKFSIFDTNENFDRLDALNNRVNPKVEKEVKNLPKQASSQVSKSLSSKEVSAKFVDGILDQETKSSYSSMHDNSVNRLYKILNDRNTKE